MSIWKDNFQNQKTLEKLRAALVALEKVDPQTLVTNLQDDYKRAVKALKTLDTRFSTLDPELFHQNMWGNLGGWANTTKVQAEGFLSNRQPGQLSAINANLDEILTNMRPVDMVFSEPQVKALGESSEIYRQKLDTELDRVKKKSEEIKGQFDLLSKEFSQVKTHLDASDKTIEAQKTRLDTSIAEFQKQFSTAQETRNQDFQKAVAQLNHSSKIQSDAFEKTVKLVLEKQAADWDSLFTATKKQSDDQLAFLNKRKKGLVSRICG
jgi:septation ring formation regulator EzrA